MAKKDFMSELAKEVHAKKQGDLTETEPAVPLISKTLRPSLEDAARFFTWLVPVSFQREPV